MKVLISTSTFAKFDSGPLEKLHQNGLETILNPYARKLKPQESIELLQDVDGVIAGVESLSQEILSQAKKLKVISRCGGGLDKVDLSAAKRLGIRVLSTPDAPTEAVAEMALALMLSLARHICQADRNLRQGSWKPIMGTLLRGKTMGIIGLGRVGKRLTQLVAPLGMKILAFDSHPDQTFTRNHQIHLVPLDELLTQSDVISLHVTLTNDTRNLINKKTLRLMKANALLVNTSRGGVVDEEALCESLTNNRLGGAALDVYEQEPYSGPLLECDRVIATSHMGSYAKEARIGMEEQAVDNLLSVFQEKPTPAISVPTTAKVKG